jgi:ankyrin repeat protein
MTRTSALLGTVAALLAASLSAQDAQRIISAAPLATNAAARSVRMRLVSQRALIAGPVSFAPLLIAAGPRAGEVHDAVAAGDLNRVRALVAANPALLDSRDELGFTPLHKACFTQQGAVARFLLDQGASVTARDAFQQTPLHRASYASGRDLALIRRLIAKGADVNALGINGITPLHWAAFKGDVALAKLLFANGADANAYDKYRGPTTTGSISGTVLQVAINQGPREDLAVLLVERGAKLNRKDSVGNTELHLAATKGYAALARRLIGHGADVHAVNQYGRAALYYAAKHGYRRVADALIGGGAATSTVVETNYGKAPQLAATLNEGEAYLWYCGSGYAVKTKGHLLLFNPSGVDTSLEAGLANGHLNPNELAGLKITVLISNPQRWPIGPDSLELAKRMPDIDVVASQRPAASGGGGPAISSYRLAVPNESFSIGGILVHTIPALAGGLGYLVEADGVRVFHAGLHLSGNVPSQLADYRKEIDFLRPFGAIDIAILSTHSHSNDIAITYEPYLYLLDRLSPKAVYLLGANIAEQYPRCADVLRARPIPVFYPEGGVAKGERFHFLRDRAVNVPGATDSDDFPTTETTSRLRRGRDLDMTMTGGRHGNGVIFAPDAQRDTGGLK